ncbi:uncharacterized protein LOC126818767 [Patella vulgata]|uniref:uncharacterized protein LOC126818767 n=1 Tax=Patella vulgata TaxID=6465 RepID=UPI0024A8C6DE|nr:uncharacterized protein LOC126818767 [Patella vulgata]
MAGGFVGLLSSYIVKKRTFNVAYLINGILGGLVGITGCVGTHALGGIWSMLAGGLFSRRDTFASELDLHAVHNGAFNNGGFHQLGVQCIAVLAIVGWTLVTSFIFLKSIQLVLGLRIPLEEEKLGADLVEHGIGNYIYDKANKKLIELEISPDEEMEQHIYNSRISRRRSTHTLGKHTEAISALAALTMANFTHAEQSSPVSEKKVTSKLGRMFRRMKILNLKTKKKATRDVKVQLESSQIMQNGFQSPSPIGNHNHGFENGTVPSAVNGRIRDERNDHRLITVSEYENDGDDLLNQEPRYFSQMTYI